MSWGQECVAIMQKSQKETYLIKKRKALDLKRKVFDLQETCQNKKNLIGLKKKTFNILRMW